MKIITFFIVRKIRLCIFMYIYMYVCVKINVHIVPRIFCLIRSCIMDWSSMFSHYVLYYDQQQTTAISTSNFFLLLKKENVLWLEGNKKENILLRMREEGRGMLWGINDFSHCIAHSLDFWVTTKSNNNCKAISSPPSSSTLLDFPFILPLVNTTMHDGDDLTWWWFWIPADTYAVYHAYYIGIHNLPLLFTFSILPNHQRSFFEKNL